MNILIATGNSPYDELSYTRFTPGGAERGLRTYAEHAASSHCVTYLSTAHKGLHLRSRVLCEKIDDVGVVHLRGPSIPRAQHLAAAAREVAWFRTVEDVCRSTCADVILTYATIPDTLAAVRAKRAIQGVKVVEWMAGRSWELHLDRVPNDIERVAEAFSGKDLTLFESAALENYSREALDSHSLPPLGRTALVEFESQWPAKTGILGRSVWPGARGQVISCMATFKPGSKRQDLLLRAWPGVLEHVGSATLVLAGDGPLRSSCMRLAEDLGIVGSVQFLGNVSREKIDLLLSASTLTVLPTEFEGRPQSILESMAAGVPVIASDIPSIREVLSPVGDVVEYMLCGNTAMEFSERIALMLTNSDVRRSVADALAAHSRRCGEGGAHGFESIDFALHRIVTEKR